MQNNNLSIRTLKKSRTLIFFIPLLLIIIVSTYLTTSPLLNSNQVFAEDHCSYTISASTDDSSTTGIEVPNGGSVMITFSGSSFYTLNFLIDGASGGSETITDEDGLQDGSGTLTRTVPTNSQDKNITVRVSTGSGVRRENCSVSGSNVVNVGSAQPPDGGNEDDGGSPPNGDNDGDGGSPPSGGDNDGNGGSPPSGGDNDGNGGSLETNFSSGILSRLDDPLNGRFTNLGQIVTSTFTSLLLLVNLYLDIHPIENINMPAETK